MGEVHSIVTEGIRRESTWMRSDGAIAFVERVADGRVYFRRELESELMRCSVATFRATYWEIRDV